jgi:D-beta-D-heptose 7-phosphate kinase/D-beta-D-heptose 1-phosphate adenosyltransferase
LLKNLEVILKKFADAKVLVIGDVMLDRYWWGNVSRISPEAPVPVVSMKKTSILAGGAANVAANIAGLGAEVRLIGITGEDEEAEIFPEILLQAGISDFNLFPVKDRKTTIKTRIIAHNQQIVRVDRETSEPLTKKEIEKIFKRIRTFFESADVLLISDYAKGFLTEEFCTRLITLANEKDKIILVDPKGRDYSKYKGATILTPNQRETAEACGLADDSQNSAENAGKLLLEKLSLEALLITQGEKGMTLLQKKKKTSHLKATARKVYDVTGAGDTVIATMAVALAVGLSFQEAAEIANFAAGLVVEKVGTAVITKDMLESHSQID